MQDDSITPLTGPTSGRRPLIAPAWHTFSILLIFAYFGVRQALLVNAGAPGTLSHAAILRGYFFSIASEWGMAYWVWAGVHWKGGTLLRTHGRPLDKLAQRRGGHRDRDSLLACLGTDGVARTSCGRSRFGANCAVSTARRIHRNFVLDSVVSIRWHLRGNCVSWISAATISRGDGQHYRRRNTARQPFLVLLILTRAGNK